MGTMNLALENQHFAKGSGENHGDDEQSRLSDDPLR
jgi:hypothetical protein